MIWKIFGQLLCLSLCALFLAILAANLPAWVAWAKPFDAETKLTASDGAESDEFGIFIAISGNTAIVGSRHGWGRTGSAYVFDMTTRKELFKLNADDGARGDYFACSVAISGNMAIVGACDGAGAAYVFDVATGNQLFKLTGTNVGNSDRFGHSVAISGNTAIVGAHRVHNGGRRTGSAFLFDVTTGNQLFYKMTASDRTERDNFGWSVAISGNTAIVGAPGDDDGGSRSGSAYLFDVSTKKQLFKLIASHATRLEEFGHSVAISGNTAVIGAPCSDERSRRSGSVYLFDVTTGNQLFKLAPSDAAAVAVTGAYFGISVGISGDTAIVGAHKRDAVGRDSGSAYLFDVTTGNQLFQLAPSDAATGDQFGKTVAISGNTAVVGAHYDNDAGTRSGSAYLFDVTNGNQILKLTASDAAEQDRFGGTVSISGYTVIVGATGGDDRGTPSGSAYAYIPEL